PAGAAGTPHGPWGDVVGPAGKAGWAEVCWPRSAARSWTAGEAPGGGLAGGGPPAAGGRGLAVQGLASPAGAAAWAGGAWVDVASRRARWSTAASTSVRRGPKRPKRPRR